jgi:hypothetical protein
MKALIITSLLLATTTTFAQSIDLKGVKTLMTQRQALLEKVYQGMAKQIVTSTKYPTEVGPCVVSETSIQTVLKVEGDKIIVHSKEKYVPAATAACAGFQPQEISVIFYEDKPSLALDFADLDEAASTITGLVKNGEIVTMLIKAENETVTVKYDFSKPSFKNLIYTQDSNQTVTGTDIADVNVNSIDLTHVLFCESSQSQNCSEGDYSDILF